MISGRVCQSCRLRLLGLSQARQAQRQHDVFSGQRRSIATAEAPLTNSDNRISDFYSRDLSPAAGRKQSLHRSKQHRSDEERRSRLTSRPRRGLTGQNSREIRPLLRQVGSSDDQLATSADTPSNGGEKNAETSGDTVITTGLKSSGSRHTAKDQADDASIHSLRKPGGSAGKHASRKPPAWTQKMKTLTNDRQKKRLGWWVKHNSEIADGGKVRSTVKGRWKPDLKGLKDKDKKAELRLAAERQAVVQHRYWGYYRHTLPEVEREAAKKSFVFWYSELGKLLNQPELLQAPWWRDEAAWLWNCKDETAMREAWEALSVEKRKQKWHNVILSTMLVAPHRLAHVTHATLQPAPPGYALADVLSFVSRRLKLLQSKVPIEKMTRADEALRLTQSILHDLPAGHVPFSQNTYGIMAQAIPPAHAAELYDMLQEQRVTLHRNTLLQFARSLAKSMFYKQKALHIVLKVSDDGHDLNAPECASVISAIFNCKPEQIPEGERPFSVKEALQSLIEKGFTPNVINVTAFLDALCWQGELDEAIRLALLFAESGAKIDGRTFGAVFKAAKATLDPEKVLKALDVAKAADAPVLNVFNNALHSVLYFSEKEAGEARVYGERVWLFQPLLRLYAEKFELEPLQRMLADALPLMMLSPTKQGGDQDSSQEWQYTRTIIPVIKNFFVDAKTPKLQPDATTLAIMLRGYIRSLKEAGDVFAFYDHFKGMLEENPNGAAAEIVKQHGSLIHDTVIMAMMERLGQAQRFQVPRQLLEILGDMLKDNVPSLTPRQGMTRQLSTKEPASASASATTTTTTDIVDTTTTSEAPSSRIPVHPPPSIFTFSILIHIFLIRHETSIAKQLLNVLREYNLEPNLPLWNAMIKGYAHMQDVKRVVATLQDLEAAGYKPDDFTYRAFARLKDQDKALKMMDRIIQKNGEVLKRDLEGGRNEEADEWEKMLIQRRA